MARQEQIVVQTRLGEKIIDVSKIIYFPKGIIGFDGMHQFTLLQIHENTPMLILQSIDDANLGLLVADPYTFLPDYTLKIGDAEQKLLCLDDPTDSTILVTVAIPHGKPHLTSLNLTGPIIVNAHKKIGLQVPQADANPPHVMLEDLVQQQEKNEEKTEKVEQKNEENLNSSQSTQSSENSIDKSSLEQSQNQEVENSSTDENQSETHTDDVEKTTTQKDSRKRVKVD